MNNNCSTGSTALLLAKQMIQGGVANCVLALGFEKMERGSLKSQVSADISSKIIFGIHKLSAVSIRLI